MPGHFTHIYTARRVSDLLLGGSFTDWPGAAIEGVEVPYSPQFCGQVMKDWEKFTAIGAVAPDLFYFSQDYNGDLLGPLSDTLMLGFATYYFFDAAMEDDWEPILLILDEVNEEFAGIIRLLIRLQKIWDDLVKAWDATIGPIVSAVGEVIDDLTGGLIAEFGVAIGEFKNALVNLGKQELTTFADIFSAFDTCVQKGWQERSFLWSDMSHYRGTSRMCQALVDQAEALNDGTPEGETRFHQFLAFALG